MKRGNPLISLFDLAIIPLRKRKMEEEEKENKKRKNDEDEVDPFKKIKGVTTMETRVESEEEKKYATQAKLYRNKEILGPLIYRNSNPEHEDYATWPLQLIVPKTKREIENEETCGKRENEHEVKKRT